MVVVVQDLKVEMERWLEEMEVVKQIQVEEVMAEAAPEVLEGEMWHCLQKAK